MDTQFQSFAEWYAQGRLSPYVKSHHMANGALSLIEAVQPSGDMSDPATKSLNLMQLMSNGVRHSSNFGAGRFEEHASAGSLYLAPPDVATDIFVRDPHAIRFVSIPSELCRHFTTGEDSSRSPLDFGRLQKNSFRSPLLTALLDKLWREARYNDHISRLFVDSAVFTVLAELHSLAARPDSGDTKRGFCDWRLRRTIEVMESRLDEDLSLEELAFGAGLSPRHYSALFRAGTGLPPHRWLVRRRIERACEMLLDPRLSITEIACACGFASSQHLATVFRKQMGASPSDYRRARLA